VTLFSIPWVIICVRLGPSTHLIRARVCPWIRVWHFYTMSHMCEKLILAHIWDASGFVLKFGCDSLGGVKDHLDDWATGLGQGDDVAMAKGEIIPLQAFNMVRGRMGKHRRPRERSSSRPKPEGYAWPDEDLWTSPRATWGHLLDPAASIVPYVIRPRLLLFHNYFVV
jgi:hypothetical protein